MMVVVVVIIIITIMADMHGLCAMCWALCISSFHDLKGSTDVHS